LRVFSRLDHFGAHTVLMGPLVAHFDEQIQGGRQNRICRNVYSQWDKERSQMVKRYSVIVVNDPGHPCFRVVKLRYINMPSQWTARTGSSFDTFLIEGYQYPGINHNLDQASRCAAYPWKELFWDQATAAA
jgi:hypothetical protein